tara:strand:- start:21 stop:215 length:195 start_codon:yes stop_codon:yes gene_type:complete
VTVDLTWVPVLVVGIDTEVVIYQSAIFETIISDGEVLGWENYRLGAVMLGIMSQMKLDSFTEEQ